MPLIVVMEDDAGTRTLVASVLKKDGYEVLAAEDGEKGLQLVERHKPDLVISDVQMPGLNGFQMLAAVRQNAAIASTPVILLTSLQERAHMRIGMNTGADDYITKPFRPGELREAVVAQLNKRVMQATLQNMAVDAKVQAVVQHALDEQKNSLAKLYEQRLAKELSDRWPTGDGHTTDEKFAHATVLFVDMLNYATLAEKLTSAELSDLVKRFYGSAGDTVHLFGARHMQFIGEGLLAVFVDSTDTKSVNHGLRAARAALGLVDSAHRMRQFLEAQDAGRELPRFSVNVALHSGPVTLTTLQDPLHGTASQTLPVGDAVSATMLLQKQLQAMGWTVAASVQMLRSVTGAVKIGARALVELPGRSAPIDAAELAGLAF
jgi:DNA-binding response OmpR family regulator